MRFSRSLRKAIAASLAFTMLAIPLAGCSRTVTKGGLSGRGAVGDFLVGGIYGGVFGGFLRPEEPLPEGAFIVELPRVNGERLLVELVGMDALRYYTHARICTEKLSRMNKDNSKPQDYLKLLLETEKLWAYAERFADMSQKLSGRLAEKESKPGYNPLAMIDKSPFGRDLFFSVAHAREGWGDPRPPEVAEREDAEKARLNWKPVEWSENIIKTYEQFPAGKGIEGLSKKLGVDAKEAHRQFEMAVSNLNRTNVAGLNFSSQEAGQIYDVGTRAAAVTKGACQVGLFIGGIILTGPLLEAGAASAGMQTAIVANWYTGLVDTIFEGVNDAHIAFTGDSNPALDEIKKYTGTLSAVTSGIMITTSFSNFALTGEQAIKNTHETLSAANLPTAGFLDKYNIGGAGVSAITDSLIWGTERVMELQEGKILGFQVIADEKGTTVMRPVEVPKDRYKSPQELSKVADSELHFLAVAPENLKNIFQQINELTDTDNLAKEILAEDARRRQEIADAENRRQEEAKRNQGASNGPVASQVEVQRRVRRNKEESNPSQNRRPANQDLPYESSKLAGYYTITSPSGDLAMRAYIKATGDKTIRVIQVQKKTDTKGKPLFSATIDPKTGSGKTDQGVVIKFQRDDSGAYTASMNDGHKTWRFVKH